MSLEQRPLSAVKYFVKRIESRHSRVKLMVEIQDRKMKDINRKLTSLWCFIFQYCIFRSRISGSAYPSPVFSASRK